MNVWMTRPARGFFLRGALAGVLASATAACGTSGTADTAADAAGAGDAAAADDATADDASAGADVAQDGSPQDTAAQDTAAQDTAPACATRAGAYAVEGSCSNGGSSIPFACMLEKDCSLTWVADYRAWTGPLTGTTFELASADGKETISGSFANANAGSYTYASGGLTCDATMARMDPSQADSLCCDVLAKDCQAGDACILVAEKAGSVDVVTTGCLPLADNPTAEGGACTQSATATGCSSGSVCVRNAGSTGNDGTCVRLCQKASDCAPSQQCDIAADAPRAGVCDVACQPFAASGCPAGQACLPALVADDQFNRSVSTACGSAGSANQGQACGNGTGCVAGLVCVQQKCTPLCDNAHACTSGACTGFGVANGPGTPAGFGFCK